MPAPTHVILLALAGAAGTLLRAGCTAVAIRLVGVGFPWGTLAVNVAGSFAFGVLAGLARSRGLLGPVQESILLVGLLGGFTTYSSFAFQTVVVGERSVPSPPSTTIPSETTVTDAPDRAAGSSSASSSSHAVISPVAASGVPT